MGEFRCTAKAIHKIMDEGVQIACWDSRTGSSKDSPFSSMANLSVTERSSFDREGGTPKGMSSSDAKIHRWISLAE